MNRRVLVQLSDSEPETRVGEYLGNQGVWAQVKWDLTGETEELRLGGSNHLVTEGSLRHEMLLNPERVQRRLKETPTDVFVQQIREATRPLKAKDLKYALEQMGLDAKTVDAAWTTARKALGTFPGIKQSKDRAPWYRWTLEQGSDAEPGASTGTRITSEPTTQENDRLDALTAETAPGTAAAVDVVTGQPSKQPDESSPDNGLQHVSVDLNHERPKSVGDVRSLLDLAAAGKLDERDIGRLQELLLASNVAPLFRVVHACIVKATPDAEAVRNLARTPLATAKALSEFSGTTWMAVAATAQLDESHEVGLLVCCLEKKSHKIDEADVPAAITGVGVGQLVTRMLFELERMSPQERTDVHLGVSSAARRILASSILDSVETSYLMRLLRCLDLVSSRRPAVGGLENSVLEAIAKGLRLTSGAPRLDDGELSVLANAASSLPFARTGGRSGLLAALARDYADNLADPRWWQGLTAEDLVIAGNGALGNVLALEAVSEKIVTPLLRQTMGRAKSRRDLAWLLSLPASVASYVPVAEASRIAMAVAATDAWMTSWLDHIRDGQGRRQLEAERDRAESLRGQAEQSLLAAQMALGEMVGRNERLQAMVTQSHRASGELRSDQERQVRIDVMRAIAELGAMVAGSAGRLTDEQLVARVESSLARQDVYPIGSRGAQMPFEPTRHDSSDMGLMSGEQVTVTRSGYTWETGQEAIVLVKAVVDRTVGMNESD